MLFLPKGGQSRYFSKQKNKGGFVILVFPPILKKLLSLPWSGMISILSYSPLISPHSIKVIAAAKSKGVARLALKSLARQRWPQGDPSHKQYPKCWYQPLTEREEARLGLYFTLSQPITAAIPPGEESLFRMALDLALNFKPISTRDLEKVKQMAESLNPIF